jgi:hypothetical protein
MRNVVILIDRSFDWTENWALRLSHALARLGRNPELVVRRLMKGQKVSVSDYDADKERTTLSYVVGMILFCFALAVLLSLAVI